ncbi:MAG: AAA family ATPase [Candidatus Dojkabacteria bacterium]
MIKVLSNKGIKHNQIPQGYFMFIFGHPKVHKTTELSKWGDKGSEEVLLIDTESGATYVDDVNRIVVTSLNPPMRIVLDSSGKPIRDKQGQTLVEPIPPEDRGYVHQTGEDMGKTMPVYSISEVIEYLGEQVNLPDFPYKTVVIDTLDAICELKQDDIAERLGTPFGTAGYGKDIGILKEEIRNIINLFLNILRPKGLNLVVVSHAKDKVKFEAGEKGKATIQLSSTLQSGVANIVSSLAEIIGYVSINKDSGEPIAEVSFDNSDEQHIGSRIKALSGKVIPFNYKSFKQTIENYKGE